MAAFSLLPAAASVPVPAIVQDFASAFLAGVRRGLSDTPYLRDDQRPSLQTLLDQGAGARAVGDRLLRSFAERKVEGALERFGRGEVNVATHPSSRVFEPLQSGQFAVRGTRPSLSGDLLEVTLSDKALREGGFYVIDEMACFLGAALQGAGWFVHDGLPMIQPAPKSTTFRIGSIDALETGLIHFFGAQAARLCFVPGTIPPDDMNELHDLGYHGIGLPMEAASAHEQIYEPLELALHDAWHGAHWSARVTPYTRHTAAALYRVLRNCLAPADLNRVRGIMDVQLVDLLLEVRGLPGVITDLQKALPRRSFLDVMRRWDPLVQR